MVGKQNSPAKSNCQPLAQPAAPADCRHRGRAEDAAAAVADLAARIKDMDPELVRRLAHARNSALSVKLAFPEGDRRFDDLDDDEDDDDENNPAAAAAAAAATIKPFPGRANASTSADEGITVGSKKETEEDDDDDDEGEDTAGEPCTGLLDGRPDNGPLSCLARARSEYGFDAVAEMDAAGLDLLARIRLVNHLRKLSADGADAQTVLVRAREVLGSRDGAVLDDDALLAPVIEGDLLLTVLEHRSDRGTGDGVEDNDDQEAGEAASVRAAIERSLKEANVL